MNEFDKKIKKIEKECLDAIKKSRNIDALEAVRIAYLGRKGTIAELMGELSAMTLEQKRILGPLFNQLKKTLQEVYEQRSKELTATPTSSVRLFDITAYKPHQLKGSLHIYTYLINQLSAIFISMGYVIADGPEVETDYYNFKALNIPDDHPARDSHDTFWLMQPDRLLRTHTSTVQIRSMEHTNVPLAIFAPGRVYRNEATDATHAFMFTQGELLFISKNVSMANLFATAQTFLQAFFESKDIHIKVKPDFFPFVEPGVQISGSCPFCKDGCSICKHTGWIELLGAGLVHPNVLRMSGINPEQYSGFAMGFGIERLAMIKYGINDVRLFHSTNIAFLDQF
jgi:phenylalanyl-tRNA synthetase alpha chain